MKKTALLLAAVFALTGFAQAQDSTDASANPNVPQLIIADGSSSKTYEEIIAQLKPFIQDQVDLKEYTPASSGAVQNLDLLLNNKVQLALLHSDVYTFRMETDPAITDKYKAVYDLYSEEVHFVALRTSKKSIGGGYFSKGKPIVLHGIEDLANLDVGAAGGGAITAQVIQAKTQIPYRFHEYKTGDAVKAALDSGEIDAAVFVGGAPLKNLEGLDNTYQILAISDTQADRLRQIYHRATVTYTNMSPEGIPTVAADCVLVGRVYKTPKFVNALAALRSTLDNKLTEIQETTGSHPKWQEVKPSSENQGKLPWMDLPSGSASAPASVTPPAAPAKTR